VSIRIGTSGWSYPSWRPGFYPANVQPEGFLRYYAEHFDTVEINATAYRLPSHDQFRRWAEAVPERFRFAPKLVLRSLGRFELFLERVSGLGQRLGPVRVVVESARDERLLAALLDATDPGLALAFDFRHESWLGTGGVVRVNELGAEPFRYIRVRELPCSDTSLAALAASLRDPAYVYFRHEDAPSAPEYAQRLRGLLEPATS
jgi:uncharacterized protein YecE (DUF72 family)